MKKNLFFDVGQTLAHPKTGNWFITPNFYNILGDIDLDIILSSEAKCMHLLDERTINTEDEEFDMFCKYYESLLHEMNYPDITTEKIRALAYDNVFNDEKIELFPDVEKLLKTLSKDYDLYIISNAWPSTYRLLKHLGIYELFTGIFISSTSGFTKDDKTLFEIALADIDPDDKNYFIDDRIDLVEMSLEYGFVPILIDREYDDETTYIKIHNLKELKEALEIMDKK